jgi:hypothetical protein
MMEGFSVWCMIYDFKVIKVRAFDFIDWMKIITFVKLLYYFKHEYFSFAKALQLQIIFYRSGHFINWYMDATCSHQLVGLPFNRVGFPIGFDYFFKFNSFVGAGAIRW